MKNLMIMVTFLVLVSTAFAADKCEIFIGEIADSKLRTDADIKNALLSKGYTFPSECDESVEVPQFVTSFIFSGIKRIENDIIAFYSNHNSFKVVATISKGSEPLSREMMLQNNSEDYRYYYDSQLKSLSVEAERYYEHNDDSNLDKRREFKSELLDAIDDLDDCAELLRKLDEV